MALFHRVEFETKCLRRIQFFFLFRPVHDDNVKGRPCRLRAPDVSLRRSLEAQVSKKQAIRVLSNGSRTSRYGFRPPTVYSEWCKKFAAQHSLQEGVGFWSWFRQPGNSQCHSYSQVQKWRDLSGYLPVHWFNKWWFMNVFKTVRFELWNSFAEMLTDLIVVLVSADFMMMEFWYLSKLQSFKQFYKYRQVECLKRVLF